MATTYKLLRTHSTQISIRRLARVVTYASDAATELVRYEKALLGVARARQHALGGSTSPSLRFALETLLPARTRGVGRHLKSVAVDRTALATFLSHSLELASEAIGEASDAEAIADAVTAALDELHSYVAAHELVAEGYFAADRALAERLGGVAPGPSEDHWNQADTVDSETVVSPQEGSMSFAAKRDLALAA